MIKQIILPSVIITTFTTFKQFDVIYLLTQQVGAKTGASLNTILTYAYEKAFITNNYGYSSAISIIIFIILIVFSSLSNMRPKEKGGRQHEEKSKGKHPPCICKPVICFHLFSGIGTGIICIIRFTECGKQFIEFRLLFFAEEFYSG